MSTPNPPAPTNVLKTATQTVDVRDNIKKIVLSDLVGLDVEIQSPIPTRVSTTLSQSINLTQQLTNDNTIPDSVKSFVTTPFYLELTIFVGLLISIDTFTSFLLFTPTRIVCYIWRVLFTKGEIVHYKRVYDCIMYTVTLMCVGIVSLIDIGKVYHYIRAESVLKLYALYNALEMFNRLLSAFTLDVHNSLLLSVQQKKVCDVFIFSLMTFGLTLTHTLTLFFHIMALNVSINSSGYALLTLLVSNNIVEIKSPVWKRMFPENVFQIVCADIVEIFEIFTFIILLCLTNFGSYDWDLVSNPQLVMAMVYSLLSILVAEVIVDCIKHMFICKFNKVPVSVYEKSRFVLLNDLISTSEAPFKIPSLDSSTVSYRRLGIPVVPLTVLFISFSLKTIPSETWSWSFLTLIGGGAYVFKFVLCSALRQLAYVTVAQTYYESDGLVTQMKKIGRYLMEKGRIPP
ncbi:hypothetical protein EIN_484790 [Entamoeba invadens IP1]|uniref:Protein TAPT1 n=1 Tax=Entamoeba invadens IP1 TaxID=370355 RepID=A0A0A1U4E6_ENTIV|nr:hypothetical protein EIN_484790 [Entamoeba invadens IP1]ELP89137.1 hypothetical protein EIN_484790 [Entamoeba invadens IP1]|eukprot:XP_004255908.1 hypothetical protein EIN_484790 [Entamoeba invadens IP1]